MLLLFKLLIHVLGVGSSAHEKRLAANKAKHGITAPTAGSKFMLRRAPLLKLNL